MIVRRWAMFERPSCCIWSSSPVLCGQMPPSRGRAPRRDPPETPDPVPALPPPTHKQDGPQALWGWCPGSGPGLRGCGDGCHMAAGVGRAVHSAGGQGLRAGRAGG